MMLPSLEDFRWEEWMRGDVAGLFSIAGSGLSEEEALRLAAEEDHLDDDDDLFDEEE
jgi:hypothetical protein